MPNFPWVSRGDAPAISDASLTALLAGADATAGSAWEVQPLAEALAELAGQPASDELEGEAEIMAAFRNQFGAPSMPTAHPTGEPPGNS